MFLPNSVVEDVLQSALSGLPDDGLLLGKFSTYRMPMISSGWAVMHRPLNARWQISRYCPLHLVMEGYQFSVICIVDFICYYCCTRTFTFRDIWKWRHCKYCASENFYMVAKRLTKSRCDWLFPLSTKVIPQNYIDVRSHLTYNLYWWVTNKRLAVSCVSLLSPAAGASRSNSALFCVTIHSKGHPACSIPLGDYGTWRLKPDRLCHCAIVTFIVVLISPTKKCNKIQNAGYFLKTVRSPHLSPKFLANSYKCSATFSTSGACLLSKRLHRKERKPDQLSQIWDTQRRHI